MALTDQEIEKLSTAIAEKLAEILKPKEIPIPQFEKQTTLHMPQRKLK